MPKVYMSKIGVISGLMALLAMTSCKDKPATKDQQTPSTDSATASTNAVTPADSSKRIVFFGNSLTAGYGVDPSEAFPAIIQGKIDSLQLGYKVVNAGLSGETTAGGKGRIDWLLQQPLDVFVLELGANDGLRGIPVSETGKNLQDIIDRVKAKYPQAKIVLAGMQVPPNMGSKYAGDFRAVFKSLAEKNNIPLINFLLEGVGGVPELNQQDGIHPTPRGHQIVANTVWGYVKPLL
ncbi:arylesterase [Paraflavitalea pollutisoli]|uniref:arylesterase n=1 Tax=Paraflavitalea pollutisoli TaxID=3034143 RepID=UPI0023ED2A0F|nr:arylesterase [Paraflavitalea sp. H1-2-19X]